MAPRSNDRPSPRIELSQVRAEPALSREAAAQPGREAGQAALKALMRLEGAIRKAAGLSELNVLVANEARGLLRARQIFVIDCEGGRVRVATVSGLPAVERGAPLIQEIERGLKRLADEEGLARRHEFRLQGLIAEDTAGVVAYPLQEMLWLPFKSAGGRPPGGLLVARETAWSEGDIGVGEHLADAMGYAHRALAAAPVRTRRFRPGRKTLLVAALALVALTFIPVPMTVLAPLEVVPREPFVVATSLDGIVDSIPVEPNQRVAQGEVVARLASVELRNKLEVAEREVQVAAAKLQKATQLAFVDVRGRHEMGLMQAELDLRIAERDYARDQLERTALRAGRAGIAVYGDRRDIVGRPVAVGDRLMEIADPEAVEVQIDIPVSDALVIRPGARAKLFLDSDPLRPVDAGIVRADYKARPRDGTNLAYRVVARLGETGAAVPRLGLRGTAQVYGETVPLWFYLFRRPISALRQWVGL